MKPAAAALVGMALVGLKIEECCNSIICHVVGLSFVLRCWCCLILREGVCVLWFGETGGCGVL